jgi:hypothetical protein
MKYLRAFAFICGCSLPLQFSAAICGSAVLKTRTHQLPRSPSAAITFDSRSAALLQFVSTA